MFGSGQTRHYFFAAIDEEDRWLCHNSEVVAGQDLVDYIVKILNARSTRLNVQIYHIELSKPTDLEWRRYRPVHSDYTLKNVLMMRSSYRDEKLNKRIAVNKEVQLLATVDEPKRQMISIDGKICENSEWIYEENEKLIFFFLEDLLFGSGHLRYYAFTELEEQSDDERWLCQHSANKAEDKPDENMGTYIKMYKNHGFKGHQAFHIELCEP